MGTTRDRDLERLARFVTERRLGLGLGREAIAQTVGLAKGTWTRLEQGLPIRDVNYAKADKALGWASGSCIDIAEGREPVVMHDEELADGHVGATVPMGDVGDAVRQSVESASIAMTDHLTAQEIRGISDRVVDDLRKLGLIP